jgi:trehalose 6-phosphate phosphatase
MVSSHALRPPPALSALLGDGPIALFLDFDGTLVGLAPGPDAIKPRPDLADRLTALSERLGGRLAVVSGRGLIDIERHIGRLKVASAGSHGADIRRSDGSAVRKGPEGLPPEIEESLRAYAATHNLYYESKPHGGALHYRAEPAAGPAADAFADDLAGEHGWTVQRGKCVVEIVPRNADKGGAVDAFMHEAPFAQARPFFIGDDLTDEAGFAACERYGGAGVLVGERAETCARYALNDVDSVHDWLSL